MATTYEPIATTTLSSAQSSVTFSSISGSYTDLVLIIAGTVNTVTTFDVTFNSDGGSNYSATRLTGDGSTGSSTRSTNNASMPLGYINTSQSVSVIHIMNYSNTTTFKTAIARGNSASGATNAIVGLWRSTSAITSITFAGGSFQPGLTATLYGIKAA
jgi:hypothetical protein